MSPAMTHGDDGPLFEGHFYNVHLAPGPIVHLARTAHPLAIPAVRAEVDRVDALLERFDRTRTGLLIDVREAPMRNDPEFEAKSVTLRPATNLRFTHSAILVRTAVGRLQIKRLNERDHLATPVFMDEAEAVAHLRHALATHAAGAPAAPPRRGMR